MLYIGNITEVAWNGIKSGICVGLNQGYAATLHDWGV